MRGVMPHSDPQPMASFPNACQIRPLPGLPPVLDGQRPMHVLDLRAAAPPPSKREAEGKRVERLPL